MWGLRGSSARYTGAVDVSLRRRLHQLSERQHGLLLRDDVLDLGVTPKVWRTLRSRDEWIGITPRVVRRAGAPVTPSQRALAAVFDVGPPAYVSHSSAAATWGVPGFRLEPLQLMVLRGGRETVTSLATTHRPTHLPDPFAAVVDGVPVVRPALMVLQLAHGMHPDRLRAMVDRLWSRRLLSGPSLERELEPVLGRGRAGSAAMRTLLDSFPEGYVPPASGIESRFAQIVADFDLGRFRRQVDLGTDEAWCGRVDFVAEEWPLIVEVQSELYHSSLTDQEADHRRRQRLRAAGFEVVEVWDAEVWHRRADVVARVRDAIWQLRAAS
jgi:very-short-patch-repair endonuclease